MASWTDQDVNSLLPGQPWTSAKALAAFENPEALAEGAAGAPYVSTGWHPYDGTHVGDGATGLIYDHATDGTVAAVTTPDFEDGYEYMIRLAGVSHNSSPASASIRARFYRETSGSYTSYFAVTDEMPGSTSVDGIIQLVFPRVPSVFARFLAFSLDSGAFYTWDESVMLGLGASQKIQKAELSASLGSIDAGKIYLYRRREYVSG